MTINYSATDTNVPARWTGLGRPLTAQEFNYDLYNLDSRVATLEGDVTVNVSISDITQPSASTLLVTMTDSTTRGPFSLPTATFRDRGAWAPTTAYLVNDTFIAPDGGLGRVTFDHTSASSFSWGANDGAGHDYYAKMLSAPGNALPSGGATAQILQKSSSADYAVTWGYKLPTGGAQYQVLTKNSATNQDASWGPVDALHVTFEASTASGLVSTNVAAALEELKADIAGGGIALSGLSDVNITEGSGINGYYLQYNSTTAKWVAAAAASNLSGLADVNITEGSGINGYFLQWNNATSKWIAAASSASLSGLSDVNVTEGAGIDGYFLKWSNATSKWVASTTALSGLSDVNVTEGAGIDGYFLKWSNATSKWVASLSGAVATALSGLSDVSVTEGSGINGYVLYWNNSASKWQAKATAASSGSGIQKGDGSGGFAAATAGTDYLAPPSGAALLKANSGGALANATAGTDYGRASIDQNSQSAAYTTVLSDAGKHIYHPSTDANARTFTIDSNANVAYPVGTAITFINETSQAVTIAITSDTLVLAGTGATGSRTLAQYGVATAVKVGSTRWYISGSGLT
ncbi:hypothetical protein JQ594_15600 [Bradyrhizobium manausense]|uniref:hypothetical protein n=1 Tax=Bradyrhizobium manausense TaxID=989370 RepID=UPI001BA5ECBC|nr:hypothetical protein [Bradyrhizobium manausense]MBR0687356.1 hypothetical protein [Bradyrhizobium manausense]